MSLALVNVLFEARSANGQPVAGARVRVRLTGYDTDADLVVPQNLDGLTDADGTLVLGLWPNSRGSRNTQYEVSITTAGASPLFAGLIVVPELPVQDQPVPARTLIAAEPAVTPDAAAQLLQQVQALQAGLEATAAQAIASVSLSRLSASALASGRVLRYVADGTVALASADQDAHAGLIAGISVTATTAAGQTVTFQARDLVTDAAWTWTAGQVVYAGLNGVLTQAYSAAWRWVGIVGVAVTPTTIHVRLQPTIGKA